MKITGIKAVCSETEQLKGYYNGHYVQINYNLRTGETWGDYHYSLGQNSWTVYHDPDIITVCNAEEPMTMDEICIVIKDAVWHHESYEQNFR